MSQDDLKIASPYLTLRTEGIPYFPYTCDMDVIGLLVLFHGDLGWWRFHLTLYAR